MLRSIIQYPHFVLLIEEDPLFAGHLIQLYSDFLSFACVAEFNDIEFIAKSNIPKIKSAIDIAIIVHRLAASLNSVSRKLLRQARVDKNMEPFRNFDRSRWQDNQRQPTIYMFKSWYQAALDDDKEKGKASSLKRKLIHHISLAMMQMMLLGEVFSESDILSPEIISWLTAIESHGYRVFVPEFLIHFEDALDSILCSSYCANEHSPFAFCSSVFDIMMPRLDDGPHMYLFGTSRRMSFAEPYVALNHSLPQANHADLDSPFFLYPETSSNDLEIIRKKIGALLFYGTLYLSQIINFQGYIT